MKKIVFLSLVIATAFFTSCKKEGCMDSLATNFDTEATADNGSCTYKGCMDADADNYDPTATIDGGNCLYKGCTTPGSLNYNPKANEDDGSCQLPERIQLSVINKFMGSLCPPCGSWGWELFEAIIDSTKGEAICIATYSESYVAESFITETANEFDVAFGAIAKRTGYPTFTLNTGVLQTSNTTWAELLGTVSDANSKNPVAQSLCKKEITADSLKISAITQFFQNTEGDYYIGAYVMEDGPIAYQAGHPDGPNTAHHKVLHGSMTPASSWGKQIVNGSISEESVYKSNFSIAINNSWNMDNVSVVLIIWEKVSSFGNNQYQYVNAYQN